MGQWSGWVTDKICEIDPVIPIARQSQTVLHLLDKSSSRVNAPIAWPLPPVRTILEIK